MEWTLPQVRQMVASVHAKGQQSYSSQSMGDAPELDTRGRVSVAVAPAPVGGRDAGLASPAWQRSWGQPHVTKEAQDN